MSINNSHKAAITKIHAAILAAILIIVAIAGGVAYVYLQPASTAEPIKIGIIIPLSPPGSYTSGQVEKRAVLIAQKYINDGGGILGRPVEFIIEDSSGIPANGVAAAEKLIASDKVVAISGLYHSSVALALVAIAEKYHVPMLCTRASAAAIMANKPAYMFRTQPADPPKVNFWFNWVNQSGFKKVYIIAEDTDYGLGQVNYAVTSQPTLAPNVTLKTTVISSKSIDVTTQLLEIKAWGPDLVIMAIGSDALNDLTLSQSFDIGLFPGVPHLGAYDFPVSPGFWSTLGQKGVGIYFTSYYHPDMNLSDLGKSFREMYFAEYGEEPTFTAVNEFGNDMILKQAIEKANSINPEDIAVALKTGAFDSWTPSKVTFPESSTTLWHQALLPVMLFQFTKVGQTLPNVKILYQLSPAQLNVS